MNMNDDGEITVDKDALLHSQRSSSAILRRLNESLDFEKERLKANALKSFDQLTMPDTSESLLRGGRSGNDPHSGQEASLSVVETSPFRRRAGTNPDPNEENSWGQALSSKEQEDLGDDWDEAEEWQNALNEARAGAAAAAAAAAARARRARAEGRVRAELLRAERVLTKKHQMEIERMKFNLEKVFERSANTSVSVLQEELHGSSEEQERALEEKWRKELGAALAALEDRHAADAERELAVARDEGCARLAAARRAHKRELEGATAAALERERALLRARAERACAELGRALQAQVAASLDGLRQALEEDQARQEAGAREAAARAAGGAAGEGARRGRAAAEARLDESVALAHSAHAALVEDLHAAVRNATLAAGFPEESALLRAVARPLGNEVEGTPLPLRRAARLTAAAADAYDEAADRVGALAEEVLKLRQAGAGRGPPGGAGRGAAAAALRFSATSLLFEPPGDDEQAAFPGGPREAEAEEEAEGGFVREYLAELRGRQGGGAGRGQGGRGQAGGAGAAAAAATGDREELFGYSRLVPSPTKASGGGAEGFEPSGIREQERATAQGPPPVASAGVGVSILQDHVDSSKLSSFNQMDHQISFLGL